MSPEPNVSVKNRKVLFLPENWNPFLNRSVRRIVTADGAIQAPVDITDTYNWVPVTWKHTAYALKDHLVNAVYGSSRCFMSMVRRPLFGQHFKSVRLKVIPANTHLAIIHKPPMLFDRHTVLTSLCDVLKTRNIKLTAVGLSDLT